MPATSKRSTQTDLNPSQTLFIGLDEAGYGPNLGPLVVAATTFLGGDSLAGKDWWTVLADHVARRAQSGRLVIDDSKRVLALNGGLEHMTNTVRFFLERRGAPLDPLEHLLAAIDLAGDANLVREHWFRPVSAVSPPVEPPPDDLIAPWPVRLAAIRCRTLFPAEFNHLLASLATKADVELACVRALLADLLDRAANAPAERIVVWIDRLGGRRYYRTLVEDLAGDAFVLTLEEGARRSRYRFQAGQREVEISFEVKADGQRLPVALASMVAKTVRERSMAGLNAFWLGHCPGLMPTAGYPQDAKRFLMAIEPSLARLGVTADQLWRAR